MHSRSSVLNCHPRSETGVSAAEVPVNAPIPRKLPTLPTLILDPLDWSWSELTPTGDLSIAEMAAARSSHSCAVAGWTQDLIFCVGGTPLQVMGADIGSFSRAAFVLDLTTGAWSSLSIPFTCQSMPCIWGGSAALISATMHSIRHTPLASTSGPAEAMIITSGACETMTSGAGMRSEPELRASWALRCAVHANRPTVSGTKPAWLYLDLTTAVSTIYNSRVGSPSGRSFHSLPASLQLIEGGQPPAVQSGTASMAMSVGVAIGSSSWLARKCSTGTQPQPTPRARGTTLSA